MNHLLARLAGALLVVVGLVCGPAAVHAQDTLASARALYGSAAYDEALLVLDRIKATPGEGSESLSVQEYRALCLLALGRQGEAERAVEVLIGSDPGFQPDAASSPRVQAVFRDVRKRVLPTIAQRRYVAAKSAYDRRDYRSAIDQFEATLVLLDAPDLAQDQASADLRTLITGFRDLAQAALPPPPPPKPAVVEAPPPQPVRKALYTMEDEDVVPPVALNQRLPRWPSGAVALRPATAKRGVIEVTITEAGTVESAIIRQSTGTFYDEMLLSEARRWKYTPATREGAPVKYRKMIQFSLQ